MFVFSKLEDEMMLCKAHKSCSAPQPLHWRFVHVFGPTERDDLISAMNSTETLHLSPFINGLGVAESWCKTQK